jgi:PPM family protein phosphatase
MLLTACFEDSYRVETEDRSAIVSLDAGLVLIVADGVGGQPGGGPAAEYTVQRVRDAVPALDIADPIAWHGLVKAIGDELWEISETGQTTLVVIAVTPKKLVGISVGDSEGWLIQRGGYFDMTGGQRRKPYLGSMADPVPFSLPRPRNGTILIATDGLFKYAPVEPIIDTALLPDIEEAATRLADLARLPTGKLPDDIAIVLCRLPEEPSVVERFLPFLRR